MWPPGSRYDLSLNKYQVRGHSDCLICISKMSSWVPDWYFSLIFHPALIIHLPNKNDALLNCRWPSHRQKSLLHSRIAGLEEILLKRGYEMFNLSSEKMQILLFKSTGTVLTAFLLADLYGKLLAAGLDRIWLKHFVSSSIRSQRVKVYCLCVLHGGSAITLRQTQRPLQGFPVPVRSGEQIHVLYEQIINIFKVTLIYSPFNHCVKAFSKLLQQTINNSKSLIISTAIITDL